MSAPPNISEVDQEFLDRAYDLAVQRVEEGLEPDAAELAAGRDDLRGEIESLIALARRVAVGPKRDLPSIEGYTILSEIGRGGMGTVYLARQRKLGGRPVALKVLPPSQTLSERARLRFRAEADTIAKLQHPNIVAIYDVVHEHTIWAYAMEWVEGVSLADAIAQRGRGGDFIQRRERKRPVGVALDNESRSAACGPELSYAAPWPIFISRIGIAIGRALGAVHAAGVVHRDVKPSNILLRRDGTPLLSDFGLAKVSSTNQEGAAPGDSASIHHLTVSGHFVGTPAYAAPEQLRGRGDRIDARTDVYSLGATLYHALALRPPVGGDNPVAVLGRIEAGRIWPLRKVNPRLPTDLETIVAKAMDTEPARRYATADEFADDLERLLGLQPIKARPPTLLSRTTKLMRRNRRVVLAATCGAILTAGLLTVLGVYVFLVPAWVAAHVANARLALMDPAMSSGVFNHGFFEWSAAPVVDIPAPPRADLLTALEHYAAAVRLAPFDEELHRERQVVQTASQAIVEIPSNPSGERRFERHDLWEAYHGKMLLDWGLRERGLYAFLVGNIDGALEAWTQYDVPSIGRVARPKAENDSFVDAALGLLYVVREEYGRAYPRLGRARDAFPEVGFLTVHLAESALHCGDIARAQAWLDRARHMPRPSGLMGLERVQAELYAASGRDAEAIELFQLAGRRLDDRGSLGNNSNGVAIYRFGQFLEARGRRYDAVKMYAEVVRQVPWGVRPRRAFAASMRGWWGSLTPGERWRAALRALREDPAHRDSLVQLLLLYLQPARPLDA